VSRFIARDLGFVEDVHHLGNERVAGHVKFTAGGVEEVRARSRTVEVEGIEVKRPLDSSTTESAILSLSLSTFPRARAPRTRQRRAPICR